MWRTFAYSISLVLILITFPGRMQGQDTIPIPLKIRLGIEVSGPGKYYSDKSILNEEAYISVDLNEKRSVILDAGYLSYKFSQYNYSYLNHGIFVRGGMDFNLLKPDKSQGKYWMGFGLSYALSHFVAETPFLEKDNYWGSTITSIPAKTYWGHYVELSPGVRAEIFKNFSMGWTINMKLLVYSSTGGDNKPIYFPGYGNGTKAISASLSYYLVWNIRYKKINAILKKEAPPEEEDNTDTTNPTNSGTNGTSGNQQNNTSGSQQNGIIRY